MNTENKTNENLVIEKMEDESDFINYAKSKINKDNEEIFFIVDLAKVAKKFIQWKKELPKIELFYAMKCNNDPVIIKMLHYLGCGFDCASPGEIDQVLNLTGCDPDRIIYANPCKFINYIEHAKMKNIKMSTFDGVEELEKIKKYFPESRVVMRIKTEDENSSIQLSKKFGAPGNKWELLIQKCKELQLDFIGLSFHIGTGSYDTSTFAKAIEDCSVVFDIAEKYGFKLNLLDLGGGFPGNDDATPSFEEFAATINLSIEKHFKNREGIRIIAEPGRFFAEDCYYIFVNIISKNIPEENEPEDEELNKIVDKYNVKKFQEVSKPRKPKYFIKEGTALTFSNAIFENCNYLPKLLEPHENQTLYDSSIYGNSGNEYEVLSKDVLLPILNENEYIYFERMGAYSVSIARGMSFNGYKLSEVKYYCWVQTSLQGFISEDEEKLSSTGVQQLLKYLSN